MKLPCFSIYGQDVQDMEDDSIPEDVQRKILLFAKAALAVGQLKNKSYLNIGSVSMGIMGSFMDPSFYIHYLGDLMTGNPKLAAIGFKEESLGRNALFAGFQGQS